MLKLFVCLTVSSISLWAATTQCEIRHSLGTAKLRSDEGIAEHVFRGEDSGGYPFRYTYRLSETDGMLRLTSEYWYLHDMGSHSETILDASWDSNTKRIVFRSPSLVTCQLEQLGPVVFQY
ncbi:MAG: hypothetical protein HYR96_00730 [Deltaproteobacteria bacterium]|nr:hypothetical protein [Deltaproteobacteria bacterium]